MCYTYTGLLQVTMKANKTYRYKKAVCVCIYIQKPGCSVSLTDRQTDRRMGD